MHIPLKKYLALLSLIAGFSCLEVYCATSTLASELSYTVETILPDNQVDKTQSYFDLKMEPNQKQELKIHMRNDTDRVVKIAPVISPATTNLNGVVEYGPAETKLNDTAPYNIQNIVKSSTEEITIPSHSSVDYRLEVSMPPKSYDGIVAGGIYFEEKNKPTEKTGQKAGLALENRFSYVVAILLRETEKTVIPELTLGKIEPTQVNSRNTITTELNNGRSVYINELKVETDIKVKNEKKILYKSSKKAMQIAPNTTLNYPTSLEGQKLKPGVYTMHVVATSGKYRWEFNKDFTISGEQARELNRKDVTIQNDNSWIYILIGVILLILSGIILLILRKRNKKNN